MLSRMAPSSPPDMRTLHLLKTPDILCANDLQYLRRPEAIFSQVSREAPARSSLVTTASRISSLPFSSNIENLPTHLCTRVPVVSVAVHHFLLAIVVITVVTA